MANTMGSYLANYVSMEASEIDRVLKLAPSKVFEDPAFTSMINKLDVEILRDTLGDAHSTLDTKLMPLLQTTLKHHNLEETAMSAYTLANWLVGYLEWPNMLGQMLEKHSRIPTNVISDVLPHIMDILADVPSEKARWQEAFAAVAMPLIATG